MTQTKTLISSVAIALLIISAGCSAFAGASGSAENTTTLTPTPEPTPEPTETSTPEPAATETSVATEEPEPVTDSDSEDGELSRAEKFQSFEEDIEILTKEGAYVEGKAFSENDTYHMTYEMRDLSNSTKTRDDRVDPLLSYNAIVDEYNKNGDEYSHPRDHTWIPDTVNVTFVTEDGEVYQTSSIKYEWAYKNYTGEWSFRVFIAKYASTIEDGPAHPDNE